MIKKWNALFSDVSRPRWIDWVFLGTIAVICFFCFSFQFDMWITMEHGKDLLEAILQGKPLQFYTLTMEKALGGGYGEPSIIHAAMYNIIVYLIFAVWVIPLYFLSSVFQIEPSALVFVKYGKLLVVICILITARLLSKLAHKLGLDTKWTVFVYLSSPLLLWSALTINQYDIFSSVFTVWALLFYVDKKFYRFSLIMAIAICCKIFPALIFVPLILLAEKRVGRIITHLFVGGSGYLITTLLYTWRDPGYRLTQNAMEEMYEFTRRIFAHAIPMAHSGIILFWVGALLVCLFSYYVTPTDKNRVQYMIYFPFAMYCVFFSFVSWHSQWLVILAPFLALAVMTIQNKKAFFFAEIVLSFGGIFWGCFYIRKTIDNYMVNNGILPALFGFSYQGTTLGAYFRELTGVPGPVFMTIFFTGMAFLVWLVFYSLHKKQTVQHQDPFDMARSVIWARPALLFGYILPTIILFFLKR